MTEHGDDGDAAAPGTGGARVVADASGVLAAAPGIVWRHDAPGRQLDANLVHLAAGREVAVHAEADLDVLLVVVAGTGTLRGDGPDALLAPGCVVWLPRGTRRGLAASDEGLAYVTTHRRRPGMTIAGP
jgi:quercetin dioxygenase-like cupin family protein